MEQSIEKGKAYLLDFAEKLTFNGQEFPWVPARSDCEVAEASARYGIPFMYSEQARFGKVKLGIMGAEPKTIEAWMQECGLELMRRAFPRLGPQAQAVGQAARSLP